MADSIKVLSTEITLTTTPNTVSGASLVRIVNTADSPNDVLVTIYDSANTVKGTFTLGHEATGFSNINIVKLPTDKIAVNTANATVVTKATSIAFT